MHAFAQIYLDHNYFVNLTGPAIIQWNYQYSCWKLFVLEMETFLETVGSGTGKRSLRNLNLGL